MIVSCVSWYDFQKSSKGKLITNLFLITLYINIPEPLILSCLSGSLFLWLFFLTIYVFNYLCLHIYLTKLNRRNTRRNVWYNVQSQRQRENTRQWKKGSQSINKLLTQDCYFFVMVRRKFNAVEYILRLAICRKSTYLGNELKMSIYFL